MNEKLQLKLNKKTQIFKGKQGVNFCGYKINEYRMKIRNKGKRKLKKKIKYLKYEIKNGRMTTKEAHKYLSGHIGYIKIANVKTLTEKLFYVECPPPIGINHKGTNSVNRGGNFNNNGDNNTACNRNNNSPTNQNNNISFRPQL